MNYLRHSTTQVLSLLDETTWYHPLSFARKNGATAELYIAIAAALARAEDPYQAQTTTSTAQHAVAAGRAKR